MGILYFLSHLAHAAAVALRCCVVEAARATGRHVGMAVSE